jgi:hypothetical protein
MNSILFTEVQLVYAVQAKGVLFYVRLTNAPYALSRGTAMKPVALRRAVSAISAPSLLVESFRPRRGCLTHRSPETKSLTSQVVLVSAVGEVIAHQDLAHSDSSARVKGR